MHEFIKQRIREVYHAAPIGAEFGDVWSKTLEVMRGTGTNIQEGCRFLKELWNAESTSAEPDLKLDSAVENWCKRLRKNLGPVAIERAEALFRSAPIAQTPGAVDVFRRTWPNFTSVDSLAVARERAAQRPKHPVADLFPEYADDVSTVANICEELQVINGEKPFWFTIDDVAETLNPDDPPREHARRIRNLLELGFLVVVRPGVGKKPTLYRLSATHNETHNRPPIV